MRISICEEYNLTTKQFKISDLQLSTPKSGFGITYQNGYFVLITFLDKIYVIGGNDGSDILDSVELYDYQAKKILHLHNLNFK